MQHQITARIERNHSIFLQNLPFADGEDVVIFIKNHTKPAPKNLNAYPLRGLPLIYRDPFLPVAEGDWESLA